VPIPEPCFEPSVVATIPQPPAAPPSTEPSPAAQPEPQTQGKVIVMFSCRGGCGATTLAVNTAAQLANAGKSVCLVDLDLQLGDVFVALDLEPQTSIAALAREASTIDPSALKRRLARHDSGIYALTQVGHLDDVDPQLVERMPALMATLASQFDYVVVDGVRDFGDCALAALDMADQVAMVLSQDVASVRRAARAVKLFRRLGYSEKKLRLVLNRTSRKARVGEPEIVRALGLAVSARVRNDFKKATGAMDDGALIGEVARGSGLDKDLGKLARTLAGPQALTRNDATSPVKKRRLFGLLSKGGN
jgi:pilus assembly protein CpaE